MIEHVNTITNILCANNHFKYSKINKQLNFK